MFKPDLPYMTPLYYHKPEFTTVKGVSKKSYSLYGQEFYCSFKTFGGTENIVNGVTVVEDTAFIETWFNPDILSEGIVKDASGQTYEILGTPENINKRNQYMKFKIRAVKGGA